MNQHQEHLLGLLKEIDQFCREYDIPYYCAGGTVIGAARHNGFIPWDDDVDIYMKRDDFYRFAKAFEEDGPKNRKLEYHEANNDYYSMVARYYREDTTMFCHFNIFGYSSAGTMIDIFVLDPIPDDHEARLEYLSKFFIYSDYVLPALSYSYRIPKQYLHLYDEYRKFSDEFGKEEAIKKISSEIFTLSEEDCSCYCLRWGSIPLIYPKDIIGDPSYLPFEDIEIPVPEKWHDYLNLHYGSSWMELPYVEGRREHNTILNYDESYEKYYELRDRLFTQEYLCDVHWKWKDAMVEMAKAERPLEKYIGDLRSRICLKHIQINLEKNDKASIKELYDNGEYTKIVEVCDPYIILQTDRNYMGELMHHASQLRWIDPFFVPLDHEEVSILLESLIRTGKMRVAEKIIEIFRRGGRLTGPVLEISKLLDCILDVIKRYYSGDYEGCLKVIDEIEDNGGIPVLIDFRWLCKVHGTFSDEDAHKLEDLYEAEDATDNIKKAWGDHLWNTDKRDEAAKVYKRLMEDCRNGLFWKDINDKGIDIPPIPIERESYFDEDDVTKKQHILLDEIIDICDTNGIHYSIGERLGRRMYVTGNIGYQYGNREILMDAANAEKFINAFESEKPKDRSLISWAYGDQVRDFSLIYSDNNSIYVDFRRLEQWKGLGINITIRILRSDSVPDKYKDSIYMKEFLLNIANLDTMDRRRLKTRKKRIIFKLTQHLVTDKTIYSRTIKFFNKSMKEEKECSSGPYYYYTNARGERPKKNEIKWDVYKDIIPLDMDGRKYNIPKFVSKGELENEPIMSNEIPRRRIFIYYDDDMTWDIVDPMIDEKEYLSLDWERYAKTLKYASDLDDEVKAVWNSMLTESIVDFQV